MSMLDIIGLIISAYNPAPQRAAVTAAAPAEIWITKLRIAMNLNSLFR